MLEIGRNGIFVTMNLEKHLASLRDALCFLGLGSGGVGRCATSTTGYVLASLRLASCFFGRDNHVCVMPSTHLSLHYHVVFATRGREPLISKTWRGQLHEYIGGTLRGLDAVAECVGGVADHVHVLMGLRASHCLADVMRELKKASSAWAADKMREDTRFANMSAPFAWQEGYAAFTVSASSCAAARAYIENQEEHHRVKSFREELVEMLDRAGVEYRGEFLD